MEEAARNRGTQAMWAAAKSIARVSGLEATVADVLHARVYRLCGEGLRQYITIRTGPDEAADLLRDLRQELAAWSATELVEAPGARARLYKLAREKIAKGRSGSHGKPATLRWFLPPPSARESYGRALTRVRSELPPEDTELLELKHARELSNDEIAFVVDLPIDEVEARLAAATARAREIVGDNPPSRLPGVEGALIEAFALVRTRSHASSTNEVAIEREALEPGTVVGERYRVEKRVGTGAFGDVYRAADTEVPGHTVALKLLHQAALSNAARGAALRELRLIASVFHPSVVSFKDHGWYRERLWFVMPWYDGETLEERIRRAPLSRAQARRVFEPLARALAAMHASGIRHQDVKPDNIFLAKMRGFGFDDDGDGEPGSHTLLPVLIDLGVAAKEAEMVLAGTPTYFAPEVAAQFSSAGPAKPVTTKADVFSLVLALRNALEPDTQEEVPGAAVEAFIAHRATTPPDAPSGKDLKYLTPTFAKWLSADPDERPTADELADQLAILTEPEERRARRMRAARWILPITVALAGIFAGVVWVLSHQTELQRLETLRAQNEARDKAARLESERAKAEVLQEDIAALREQYESSALSRQDLAQRLATSERQAELLGADVAALQDRTRTLRDSLAAARTESDTLRTQLAAMTTRADGLAHDVELSRARSVELSTQLEAMRAHAQQSDRDLADSRARSADLAGQLEIARSERASLQNRVADLEQRLATAEAARERVEQQLVDLRRALAEAESRGRSPTGSADEPSPPLPSPESPPP